MKTKSVTGDDERGGRVFFSLPANHVIDLRAIATGVEESDVGICCRYLIDQLTSANQLDVDDDGFVHHLEAVERYCDRFGVWRHPLVVSWRSRLKRARRALERLRRAGENDAVSVLYIAHGYPDPLARQLPELVPLGELASLVRYVDVVEERRVEMARAELTRYDAGEVVNLADRRERLAWALRTISSADALRAALAPFSEPPDERRPGEPAHAHEARLAARSERRARHRERVGVFVSAARVQAAALLSNAEELYYSSWLQSAV